MIGFFSSSIDLIKMSEYSHQEQQMKDNQSKYEQLQQQGQHQQETHAKQLEQLNKDYHVQQQTNADRLQRVSSFVIVYSIDFVR
jgi:LAS superfamily LD-carboxypeptidase LdcB